MRALVRVTGDPDSIRFNSTERNLDSPEQLLISNNDGRLARLSWAFHSPAANDKDPSIPLLRHALVSHHLRGKDKSYTWRAEDRLARFRAHVVSPIDITIGDLTVALQIISIVVP